MKIFLTSTCLILLSAAIKAQQIVVNSLYQNNISYYNPAYTASQYKLRGGLQYRRQWDNWPGAPVNYMGQYEHNLDSIIRDWNAHSLLYLHIKRLSVLEENKVTSIHLHTHRCSVDFERSVG